MDNISAAKLQLLRCVARIEETYREMRERVFTDKRLAGMGWVEANEAADDAAREVWEREWKKLGDEYAEDSDLF